jgi:RimJ/RimL family protein N-acetyltransferase
MHKHNIVFLEGTKVILRPVLEEDISFFFESMNNPKVTQYLAAYLPISLGDERAWFEKVSKQSTNSITLAIVDKAKNAVIGTIGLGKIDYKNGTATTGTSIGNPSYWGQGYGTEAKMLFLEYIFKELNLRKIYSEVIAYNKRSLAYAKKCGYALEGQIPKHYYRKGRYWDKYILAAYKDSWIKKFKNWRK